MNRRELIFGTLLAPVVAPFASLMTKPAPPMDATAGSFEIEWDHISVGTGPDDFIERIMMPYWDAGFTGSGTAPLSKHENILYNEWKLRNGYA